MSVSGSIKFLYAVLLLTTLLGKANCQCSLADVTISQSPTGAFVEKATEWKVTINNPCPCNVAGINLQCSGFQTEEKPDPAILAINDSQCLVNNGLPFSPRSSLTFNYAWNTKYDFKVISGYVACS